MQAAGIMLSQRELVPGTRTVGWLAKKALWIVGGLAATVVVFVVWLTLMDPRTFKIGRWTAEEDICSIGQMGKQRQGSVLLWKQQHANLLGVIVSVSLPERHPPSRENGLLHVYGRGGKQLAAYETKADYDEQGVSEGFVTYNAVFAGYTIPQKLYEALTSDRVEMTFNDGRWHDFELIGSRKALDWFQACSEAQP